MYPPSRSKRPASFPDLHTPRLVLLLVASTLLGCTGMRPTGDTHSSLRGNVSFNGSGFAGAQVFLYPTQFFLPPEQPPVAIAPSAEDGTFHFEVAPGRYLLLARHGNYFGYFGRNPVQLTGSIDGVHLPLVETHPVHREEKAGAEERVEGRVLQQGQPVAGAKVFVYLDPTHGFRGPGYAVSEPTDHGGYFSLPLPPGTYFLVARQRAHVGKRGTLEPGDLFGVCAEFPLRLGASEQARTDIETVAVPTREQMARYRDRSSLLSGRIVGQRGQPIAGMRACLYDNAQMLNRPLAMSEPTGPDGWFSLHTDHTGDIFLGARQELGGPPVAGERIGFYRGEGGARIRLHTGEILEGLTIIVQGVP